MKVKQNKKSFTITPTQEEATLLASLFNQTDIIDIPRYEKVGISGNDWESVCLSLTLAFIAVGGDRNQYPSAIRCALKKKLTIT